MRSEAFRVLTNRHIELKNTHCRPVAEPKNAQFEKRLHSWFSASEQYARQLHEMSWDQYLEMKSSEHARMLKK